MEKWIPCKIPHTWEKTNRIGIFVCVKCGAQGYQKTYISPANNEVTGQISPYKCPRCGSSTTEGQSPCPNCLKLINQRKQQQKTIEKLTLDQIELLQQLQNEEMETLPQKSISPMTSLKRRGLVERKIKTIWYITPEGKDILKDHPLNVRRKK